MRIKQMEIGMWYISCLNKDENKNESRKVNKKQKYHIHNKR